ncbi:PKD domain-containing protein [Halobiforma nitratireducens]|uniref:PKD domain-containing protein n=1 Tax=Halobiforma nitratireducens JCM 10879 TaxID=1227454 RepID=M0MLA5_9EURY|nr:PKD domain-containing protein [Halobiforma nitratireducens]EMA46446.1 PKD domain-containing protein [Halobiforma nitratireducens JCM 10879]
MSEKNDSDGVTDQSTTRRRTLASVGTAATGLMAMSGMASGSNDDVQILVDPETPSVGEETVFTSTVGFADHSWTISGPDGFEQSTDETVSVTFESAGEYTAYLSVEMSDGSVNVSKSGDITSDEDIDVEPTAAIDLDVGGTTKMDGSDSSTPAGEIEQYDWYFRNRSRNPDRGVFETSPNMSGETAEESFASDTLWEIGLEVTNTGGNTDRETVEFRSPEEPTAAFLVDGSENNLLPSNPVELDAGISSSPNGAIENYHWEIMNLDTGEEQTETGETLSLSLESELRYKAQLTITDEDGMEDTEVGSSFWPDADNVPE